MSVFYDLASLVLVPSGYKAQKVYAQKPLTADGQLAFSRASTATRVNASGLVETVASNVPRLDYLGSTCPKLLLEPQRTNLVTYSEAFNVGASWDKSDVSVTADTTVSPSGIQNADTINATADGQRINQSITVSASTQYTFSFYAKKGTMATPRYSVFDLSNSAFILTQVDYSGLVNTSTWSRITATFTTPAGCTSVGVYPINGASNGTIFLWGAQLESGAHPTSYIPTEGTAVTRLADFASKTGIASLIGQSEGTVFVEVDIRNTVNVSRIPIAISSPNPGTSTSEAYFFINGSGNLVFELITAGIPQCGISAGPVQLGVQKLALAYKNNDFVFYRNGQFVGDDGTGTVASGFDQISLGSYTNGSAEFNDRISQALLFKTRLTNAQLAELTSL
jgi:hypothetical protein